jgi:hypothetical protein
MTPDVRGTLLANSTVNTLTGGRVFQVVATQGSARPYIVWQIVSATPVNNISDPPEQDDQRIQIDIYANDQPICNQLAVAARDAIESVTHIVFGPWQDFEQDTKMYRVSFDAEYWLDR